MLNGLVFYGLFSTHRLGLVVLLQHAPGQNLKFSFADTNLSQPIEHSRLLTVT